MHLQIARIGTEQTSHGFRCKIGLHDIIRATLRQPPDPKGVTAVEFAVIWISVVSAANIIAQYYLGPRFQSGVKGHEKFRPAALGYVRHPVHGIPDIE